MEYKHYSSMRTVNFTNLDVLANKRVGIIGAHSCGKTTLVNTLKKYVKTNFISEVASQIHPDDRLTLEAQFEILKMQIAEENKYIGFISDRTVIDNLAYFLLVKDKYYNKNLSEIDKKYVEEYTYTYCRHLNEIPYDMFIFIDELLPLQPSPHRNFMTVYDQAFVYIQMHDMLQKEIDVLEQSVPVIYLHGRTNERLKMLNDALISIS